MKNGTIVKVTAGRLGGWDNAELNGRPSDDVVTTGWVGEIVRPLDYEPGEWYLASFAVAPGGKTLFVPVATDHVEEVS
jgi:hypothetical protein